MLNVNSNFTDRPIELTNISEPAAYPEGTVIMRPGLEVTHIYEVISGYVKVYKLNERKEKSIHIIFGPGDMFPLSWLIDKSPFEVHVKAHNDVQLLLYRKDAFMGLIHTNPEVSFFVMAKLIGQIRIYSARVDNLEYRYASQRLAYRLVYIAGRFGVEQGTETLLPAFTNQDMASMLNLSREYINKELRRFGRLGLIKIMGKQICIINMAGLRDEIGKNPHSSSAHSI